MKNLKSKIKYTQLPSEYQEVEYIESSGTQYIDSSYMPNQDTIVNCHINLVSYNGNDVFFGQRVAYMDKQYEVVAFNTEYAPQLRYDNQTTGAISGSTLSIGDHYIETSKNGLFIDNNRVGNTLNAATFTCQYSIYLFARNNAGTASSFSNIKLYSLEISENNTLIRNFVPCYRISDGEVGLYDTVNGLFYTNAGTGVFTKGADIIKDKASLRTYTASKNLNLLKLTRTEWNSTSYQPTDTVVFDYNKLYYMAGSGYVRPYDNALNATITNHSVGMTATSSSWWGIGFPIKVSPSTKYTISAKRYDGDKTKLLYTVYNSDGTFSRYGQLTSNVNILDITHTITMGANEDTLIVVVAGIAQGDTVYAYDIQVEEGQTATAFMPYGKGSVKSICERIKTSMLPNAYQEVEWIKSNNNAYINPNVNITADIGFEVTANIPTGTNGVILGNYLPGNYFFFVYAYTNNTTTFFPSKNASIVSMTVARDTKTTFSFKNGVLDDGTTQTTVSTYATAEIGQPLYLFTGRPTQWFTSYTLYKCKIYNGSTAVRDLIPCYRKSDNEAGLYDLVNNQFYTNAGTGTFSVGGNIY